MVNGRINLLILLQAILVACTYSQLTPEWLQLSVGCFENTLQIRQQAEISASIQWDGSNICGKWQQWRDVRLNVVNKDYYCHFSKQGCLLRLPIDQIRCHEDHIIQLVVTTTQQIKQFEVESRILCVMAQIPEDLFPIDGRVLQEGVAPEESPSERQGFEVVLDDIVVEDEYGEGKEYEGNETNFNVQSKRYQPNQPPATVYCISQKLNTPQETTNYHQSNANAQNPTSLQLCNSTMGTILVPNSNNTTAKQTTFTYFQEQILKHRILEQSDTGLGLVPETPEPNPVIYTIYTRSVPQATQYIPGYVVPDEFEDVTAPLYHLGYQAFKLSTPAYVEEQMQAPWYPGFANFSVQEQHPSIYGDMYTPTYMSYAQVPTPTYAAGAVPRQLPVDPLPNSLVPPSFPSYLKLDKFIPAIYSPSTSALHASNQQLANATSIPLSIGNVTSPGSVDLLKPFVRVKSLQPQPSLYALPPQSVPTPYGVNRGFAHRSDSLTQSIPQKVSRAAVYGKDNLDVYTSFNSAMYGTNKQSFPQPTGSVQYNADVQMANYAPSQLSQSSSEVIDDFQVELNLGTMSQRYNQYVPDMDVLYNSKKQSTPPESTLQQVINSKAGYYQTSDLQKDVTKSIVEGVIKPPLPRRKQNMAPTYSTGQHNGLNQQGVHWQDGQGSNGPVYTSAFNYNVGIGYSTNTTPQVQQLGSNSGVAYQRPDPHQVIAVYIGQQQSEQQPPHQTSLASPVFSDSDSVTNVVLQNTGAKSTAQYGRPNDLSPTGVRQGEQGSDGTGSYERNTIGYPASSVTGSTVINFHSVGYSAMPGYYNTVLTSRLQNGESFEVELPSVNPSYSHQNKSGLTPIAPHPSLNSAVPPPPEAPTQGPIYSTPPVQHSFSRYTGPSLNFQSQLKHSVVAIEQGHTDADSISVVNSASYQPQPNYFSGYNTAASVLPSYPRYASDQATYGLQQTGNQSPMIQQEALMTPSVSVSHSTKVSQQPFSNSQQVWENQVAILAKAQLKASYPDYSSILQSSPLFVNSYGAYGTLDQSNKAPSNFFVTYGAHAPSPKDSEESGVPKSINSSTDQTYFTYVDAHGLYKQHHLYDSVVHSQKQGKLEPAKVPQLVVYGEGKASSGYDDSVALYSYNISGSSNWYEKKSTPSQYVGVFDKPQQGTYKSSFELQQILEYAFDRPIGDSKQYGYGYQHVGSDTNNEQPLTEEYKSPGNISGGNIGNYGSTIVWHSVLGQYSIGSKQRGTMLSSYHYGNGDSAANYKFIQYPQSLTVNSAAKPTVAYPLYSAGTSLHTPTDITDSASSQPQQQVLYGSQPISVAGLLPWRDNMAALYQTQTSPADGAFSAYGGRPSFGYGNGGAHLKFGNIPSVVRAAIHGEHANRVGAPAYTSRPTPSPAYGQYTPVVRLEGYSSQQQGSPWNGQLSRETYGGPLYGQVIPPDRAWSSSGQMLYYAPVIGSYARDESSTAQALIVAETQLENAYSQPSTGSDTLHFSSLSAGLYRYGRYSIAAVPLGLVNEAGSYSGTSQINVYGLQQPTGLTISYGINALYGQRTAQDDSTLIELHRAHTTPTHPFQTVIVHGYAPPKGNPVYSNERTNGMGIDLYNAYGSQVKFESQKERRDYVKYQSGLAYKGYATPNAIYNYLGTYSNEKQLNNSTQSASQYGVGSPSGILYGAIKQSIREVKGFYSPPKAAAPLNSRDSVGYLVSYGYRAQYPEQPQALYLMINQAQESKSDGRAIVTQGALQYGNNQNVRQQYAVQHNLGYSSMYGVIPSDISTIGPGLDLSQTPTVGVQSHSSHSSHYVGQAQYPGLGYGVYGQLDLPQVSQQAGSITIQYQQQHVAYNGQEQSAMQQNEKVSGMYGQYSWYRGQTEGRYDQQTQYNDQSKGIYNQYQYHIHQLQTNYGQYPQSSNSNIVYQQQQGQQLQDGYGEYAQYTEQTKGTYGQQQMHNVQLQGYYGLQQQQKEYVATNYGQVQLYDQQSYGNYGYQQQYGLYSKGSNGQQQQYISYDIGVYGSYQYAIEQQVRSGWYAQYSVQSKGNSQQFSGNPKGNKGLYAFHQEQINGSYLKQLQQGGQQQDSRGQYAYNQQQSIGSYGYQQPQYTQYITGSYGYQYRRQSPPNYGYQRWNSNQPTDTYGQFLQPSYSRLGIGGVDQYKLRSIGQYIIQQPITNQYSAYNGLSISQMGYFNKQNSGPGDLQHFAKVQLPSYGQEQPHSYGWSNENVDELSTMRISGDSVSSETLGGAYIIYSGLLDLTKKRDWQSNDKNSEADILPAQYSAYNGLRSEVMGLYLPQHAGQYGANDQAVDYQYGKGLSEKPTNNNANKPQRSAIVLIGHYEMSASGPYKQSVPNLDHLVGYSTQSSTVRGQYSKMLKPDQHSLYGGLYNTLDQPSSSQNSGRYSNTHWLQSGVYGRINVGAQGLYSVHNNMQHGIEENAEINHNGYSGPGIGKANLTDATILRSRHTRSQPSYEDDSVPEYMSSISYTGYGESIPYISRINSWYGASTIGYLAHGDRSSLRSDVIEPSLSQAYGQNGLQQSVSGQYSDDSRVSDSGSVAGLRSKQISGQNSTTLPLPRQPEMFSGLAYNTAVSQNTQTSRYSSNPQAIYQSTSVQPTYQTQNILIDREQINAELNQPQPQQDGVGALGLNPGMVYIVDESEPVIQFAGGDQPSPGIYSGALYGIATQQSLDAAYANLKNSPKTHQLLPYHSVAYDSSTYLPAIPNSSVTHRDSDVPSSASVKVIVAPSQEARNQAKAPSIDDYEDIALFDDMDHTAAPQAAVGPQDSLETGQSDSSASQPASNDDYKGDGDMEQSEEVTEQKELRGSKKRDSRKGAEIGGTKLKKISGTKQQKKQNKQKEIPKKQQSPNSGKKNETNDPIGLAEDNTDAATSTDPKPPSLTPSNSTEPAGPVDPLPKEEDPESEDYAITESNANDSTSEENEYASEVNDSYVSDELDDTSRKNISQTEPKAESERDEKATSGVDEGSKDGQGTKGEEESGVTAPGKEAGTPEGDLELEDTGSAKGKDVSEGKGESKGATGEDIKDGGVDDSSVDKKLSDSGKGKGKDKAITTENEEGESEVVGSGESSGDESTGTDKGDLDSEDYKEDYESTGKGDGTKNKKVGATDTAVAAGTEDVPAVEAEDKPSAPQKKGNSTLPVPPSSDSTASQNKDIDEPVVESDEDADEAPAKAEDGEAPVSNTDKTQLPGERAAQNSSQPTVKREETPTVPTSDGSIQEREESVTETPAPPKQQVFSGCNSRQCYGIKLNDYRAMQSLSKAFGLKPNKNPCAYSWVVCSPCKSAKHLTCVFQLDMSDLTVVNSEQVTQVLNRFSQLQQVALPQSPQIQQQQVIINSTDISRNSSTTPGEERPTRQATPNREQEGEEEQDDVAPLAPVEDLNNGSKIEVSKAINQTQLSEEAQADLQKFRDKIKQQAENNEVPANTTISVVGVSSDNGTTVITTITQNVDQDKVSTFTQTLRQASESGDIEPAAGTPVQVASPDATELPSETLDLPNNSMNVTVQVLNDSITKLSYKDLSEFYTNDRIGQTVPDLRYQCNEFRNKMGHNDELSRDRYLSSSTYNECDNLELAMSTTSVVELLVKTSKPVDAIPYGDQETAFGLKGVTVLNATALNRTTLEPTSQAEATHWSVFVHINMDHQVAYLYVEKSTLKSVTSPPQSNIISNVLAILLDNRAPTPAIETVDHYDLTFQDLPVFTVYFWESIKLRQGKSMNDLVTLRGGQQGKGMPYWIVEGDKPVQGDSRGALQDGIVTVTVGLKDATKKYDIRLTVNPGILTDYAGNLNKQANMTLRYRPPDQTLKGFSAAAGATVALSTGAAVGASMGLPGTAAIGGVSGLFMIWQTQKFVMKKNMAVPNLPHMYRYASDQLRWLSLDIPLPWQGAGPIQTVKPLESSRAGRTLAQVVTDDAEQTVQIAYIPQSKKEQAFNNYKRTMFWAFLILAGVAIIHLIVLTVFSAISKHPPDVLLLPRGELLVALLLTLPVISASIRMLFGTPVNLALGVISLFIAVCFIVFAFTLIWYNLYHLPISKRRAHFIVEDHRQRVMHSYKHSKVDHFNASITDKQLYHDSQCYSPTIIDSSANSSDTADRSPIISGIHTSDSPSNQPSHGYLQHYHGPIAESIEPSPVCESSSSNRNDPEGYRFGRSDSAFSGNLRVISRGVRSMLRTRSKAPNQQRSLLFGALSPSTSSIADSRTKFSVLGRSQQNSYGTQSDERKTWVETIKVPVYSFFGSQGEWIPGRHRDSKFVAKYGSLFEDTRGQPLIREGATYDFDPVTGRVNRGRLVPLEEPALFYFFGRPVRASSITAYALVIEAVKLGMLAVLLEAVDSVQSYAQVSGLMVITIAHLIYVRVCKPFASPRDVMIVLIGDCADLGTFVCGILLLSSSRENETFQHRVGVAMIVMEFVALAAYILERMSRLWRMCARVLYPSIARRFGRETPSQQFADVVYTVMAKDPGILARKFGDRWLTKGLGRGLQHRLLRRKEQSVRQVLGNGMRKSLSRTASGIGLLLPGGPSGSLSDNNSVNGDMQSSMSFGKRREGSQTSGVGARRASGQLPLPSTVDEDKYGLFDIMSVDTTPLSQSPQINETNRVIGAAKPQSPGSTMLDVWSKISSPKWDSAAQDDLQVDQLEWPGSGHAPDFSGTGSMSDMYSHASSPHADDQATQTDAVLQSEGSVESQLSFSNMLQCATDNRSSARSGDGQDTQSTVHSPNAQHVTPESTGASSSRSSPCEHSAFVPGPLGANANIKGKAVAGPPERAAYPDPSSHNITLDQSPLHSSQSPLSCLGHSSNTTRPVSSQGTLVLDARSPSPTPSGGSSRSSFQQYSRSSLISQPDNEVGILNPEELVAQLSPTRRSTSPQEETRRPGSPPPEWASVALRPRSVSPSRGSTSSDFGSPSDCARSSHELARKAISRAHHPEIESAPVQAPLKVQEQHTIFLAANSLLNQDSVRSDGTKVPKIKADFKAQRVERSLVTGNYSMVTPRNDSGSSGASSLQSDANSQSDALWKFKYFRGDKTSGI